MAEVARHVGSGVAQLLPAATALWLGVLAGAAAVAKLTVLATGPAAPIERNVLAWFHGNYRPDIARVIEKLGVVGSPTAGLPLHALTAAHVFCKNRRLGTFVASASLGTILHYVILNRVLFARVRPKWFRPDARFSGTSFPSGHALTSMTLAVSAQAVLRELRVPHRGWLSAAILLAAGGLGVSRLYLQAHHPSDVVGAWALSAGWTLALARLFHRN